MSDMSWLGGAINGTVGLVNGVLQYISNKKTNENNKNIADQNLGFQRDTLDYQKALQKEIFDREDTAYQRTVNDMRLAGLNPLSMQGTNGAGEAISTEPIHNDFQYQNQLSGVFDVINQFMNMRSNSTLSNAQANLVNAQAESQKIQNKYEEAQILKALDSAELENVGKRFRNERDNIQWLNDLKDYMFLDQFNLSNNMPDWLKSINIATHQGSYDSTNFSKIAKKDWSEFGFDPYGYSNPNKMSFNNVGDILNKNANLKGAIMENKIGAILLQMLGIK